MSIQPGRCVCALLIVAAAAACTRRQAPKTDENLSAALRRAVDVRQPGFAAGDGDRGREVWKEEQRWTPDKIAAAMQSGAEQAVRLKEQLPIYLAYFTAWEEGGALKTVPDVYGLDRRHDAAKGQ